VLGKAGSIRLVGVSAAHGRKLAVQQSGQEPRAGPTKLQVLRLVCTESWAVVSNCGMGHSSRLLKIQAVCERAVFGCKTPWDANDGGKGHGR
jgi:hypothetical protein